MSNESKSVAPAMVGTPEKPAAEDYTPIGHYYEPIPLYGGKVLKYQGIACPMNWAWMMAKPGMLMLDAYKGDRIKADTFEVWTQC